MLLRRRYGVEKLEKFIYEQMKKLGNDLRFQSLKRKNSRKSGYLKAKQPFHDFRMK